VDEDPLFHAVWYFYSCLTFCYRFSVTIWREYEDLGTRLMKKLRGLGENCFLPFLDFAKTEHFLQHCAEFYRKKPKEEMDNQIKL
jgi:hypothetical protein